MFLFFQRDIIVLTNLRVENRYDKNVTRKPTEPGYHVSIRSYRPESIFHFFFFFFKNRTDKILWIPGPVAERRKFAGDVLPISHGNIVMLHMG